MQAENASRRRGEEQPRRRPRRKSLVREILEWVLILVVALVVARVVHAFVFQPVRVDGDSMRETLHDGEYMIATKWDYRLGTPERFDIVICHYPDPDEMRSLALARPDTGVRRSGGVFQQAENFVKRVVGLPGETVELREGDLYIDGAHVPELFDKTESLRDFGPVVVPEGYYFVMGDNRNNSHDSRYQDVGPLPASMIIGHVRFVAFPLNQIRSVQISAPEGASM